MGAQKSNPLPENPQLSSRLNHDRRGQFRVKVEPHRTRRLRGLDPELLSRPNVPLSGHEQEKQNTKPSGYGSKTLLASVNWLNARNR